MNIEQVKEQARKDAEAHYLHLAFEADPSIENTHGWEQLLIAHESDRIEAYAAALIAERTKASTSEGDQLSKEEVDQAVEGLMTVYRKWDAFWNMRRSAGPARMTGNLKARLKKHLRDHGLLSDPRRSKMVEAESLRLLETLQHKHRCKGGTFAGYGRRFPNPCTCGLSAHIELLRRRLGGEDGGGPLSGDGGGDLGVPASEGGRPTAAAGDDAEPTPSSSRAPAQGPIDAVPAREAEMSPLDPDQRTQAERMAAYLFPAHPSVLNCEYMAAVKALGYVIANGWVIPATPEP